MSAIFRTAAIFSGFAATGAATLYSTSQRQTDFSAVAKKVSELDVVPQVQKPRLPSEFFSFTFRDFKVSNAL